MWVKCGKVILVLLLAVPAVRGFDEGFFRAVAAVDDWPVGLKRCRRELVLTGKALVRGDEWALQMADASTKLPSGLLTGNLVDFGNFDECLGVASSVVGLRPVHCVASFQVRSNRTKGDSDLRVFRWSYCLPLSCSAEFLDFFLPRVLDLFPLGENVRVLPSDCHAKSPGVSAPEALGILIWSVVLFLVTASTIYDVAAVSLKAERNPWLTSFSARANVARLLDTDVSPDTLKPLNGLRFLSIAWIILGHRYYFTALVPIMNLIEVPEEFEKVHFQIFVGGVLAVDTFFLISGLLNSYLLLGVLNRTKKFPAIKYYVHRYLRTTPALAAVVIMYSTWFVLLGSGPGWNGMTLHSRDLCTEYWWSTLLYINNYYNPVNQCAGQSWYLAVDMQLYWLAPLVVIPIWKWPRSTKFYLGFLLLLSAFVQFMVAAFNGLRMSFSISADQREYNRTTELLYVPTHTRATPYVIGIMLGAYLDGVRNRGEKPKWTPVFVAMGWLTSAVLCLGVLFGNYPLFQWEKDNSYQHLFEAALYIGLHRVGWGLGVGWVILACLFGRGGVVNSFLSCKFFVPLGRLTYCIFLTHMAVQQYQLGTVRTTGYYQTFDQFHRYFGDLIFSVLAALALYLLFESPFAVLERLAFGKGEPPRKDLRSYTNNAYQET